MRAICEKNIRT